MWGQNIKSRFKSTGAFNLYYEASNAYTLSAFNSKFEEIERRFPSIAQYLKEIVGFELWAQAHFPGKRYNIMTSNVAESLNSMFKKSREFHVVALLDAIQAKMSSWFNDRCKIAVGIKSPLMPLMEEKVREQWNEAETFKVNQLNAIKFDVRGDLIEALVDLGRRSCSYKVFDIEKLPCSHAIAACNSVKMDLYSFVLSATNQMHGLLLIKA
ncbi:hypothetical protein UlMin_041885 [Ulmus minor]